MYDQKNQDSMVKKEDLRVILGATDPFVDGLEFEVKDYETHPKYTYPEAVVVERGTSLVFHNLSV